MTNFNRVTDLRKMLQHVDEKPDYFRTFCDRFTRCECIEWNLNNAAKLITLIVFVLTFIMVVNALR